MELWWSWMNSVGSKHEGQWESGTNESEEGIWGYEDWEKNTCKVNLWTNDLVKRFTVWVVTGDGRYLDVDDREDGTCICGGKDETACDEKGDKDEDGYDIDWGKDLINWTGGLLLGGDGSALFNDTGSNGFANGNKVNLVFRSPFSNHLPHKQSFTSSFISCLW